MENEDRNPNDDVAHLFGPPAGPELMLQYPPHLPQSETQPVWCGPNRLKAARDLARRKGVPFEIDNDHLHRLYELQGGKCYYTGWALDTLQVPKQGKDDHSLVITRPRLWTIDCRDPAKGYIRGNVVWAALMITAMKAGLEEMEFRRACASVLGQNPNWQPGPPAVTLRIPVEDSPPSESSPPGDCTPASPPSVASVHLPLNISPTTGLAIEPDDFVKRLVGQLD